MSMIRYAVIDRLSDGRAALAYLVENEDEAFDLLEDNGEVWEVNIPRGIISCRNGIPVGDDGREETAARLASELKPYRIWSEIFTPHNPHS